MTESLMRCTRKGRQFTAIQYTKENTKEVTNFVSVYGYLTLNNEIAITRIGAYRNAKYGDYIVKADYAYEFNGYQYDVLSAEEFEVQYTRG